MDKNLKPYATTKRRKFFDWNAFLAQDTIKAADWVKAKVRAGSWVSCACGNQCAIIPRNNDGQPLDNSLYHSGMQFYQAIQDKDVAQARIVLGWIENRSVYLIEKLQTAAISQ